MLSKHFPASNLKNCVGPCQTMGSETIFLRGSFKQQNYFGFEGYREALQSVFLTWFLLIYEQPTNVCPYHCSHKLSISNEYQFSIYHYISIGMNILPNKV